MGVKKEGSFEDNYEKKQKDEFKEEVKDYLKKENVPFKEDVKLAPKKNKKEKNKNGEKQQEKKESQETLEEVELEPVLYDNQPMWLCVKKKKAIPVVPGRSIKQILKEPLDLEPELVTTFEIKKQGLWQCRRCYTIIESNPGKPEVCYEDQGGCGRASTFDNVTKIINPDRWKLPRWEHIEDLSMLEVYDDLIDLLKQVLVFPDDIYYKMFALWIMSQYKWECWNSVAFWIFRGLQNSGKTRALELIHELGYRAIFTTSTTFTAMCRLTHYHNAIVLVDEADTNLNQSTETGQEFLRFVRSSYRKGSVYMTADKENQEETFCYRNFGFKAFAAEKTFNVALLTRSIVVNMEKDFPEHTELRYVQKELNDIQNKLLNYRHKFDNPPDLGERFCLKGRNREIFESIIATGMHIGVVVDDIIVFAQEHEKEEEEAMADSEEFEILKAIKDLTEIETLLDAPESVPLSDIFTNMGWDETYGSDPKEARNAHQRIGYFMKNNGLKTKRLKTGKALLFNDEKNQKKLKYLWKRYRV